MPVPRACVWLQPRVLCARLLLCAFDPLTLPVRAASVCVRGLAAGVSRGPPVRLCRNAVWRADRVRGIHLC